MYKQYVADPQEPESKPTVVVKVEVQNEDTAVCALNLLFIAKDEFLIISNFLPGDSSSAFSSGIMAEQDLRQEGVVTR